MLIPTGWVGLGYGFGVAQLEAMHVLMSVRVEELKQSQLDSTPPPMGIYFTAVGLVVGVAGVV